MKNIKYTIAKVLGGLNYLEFKRCMRRNQQLRGTYRKFKCISVYNPDKFREIKLYNDDWNKNILQKKTYVRFAFIVFTASVWNVDELYKYLVADKRFLVDIIVGRYKKVKKGEKEEEFEQTKHFFTDKQYPFLVADDIKSLEDYDIVFTMNPYPPPDKQLYLFHIPLDTIVLHTSYSYMLAGNKNKTNLFMYHCAYRYYTDSDYYRTLVDKSELSTGSAVWMGFLKMDQFFEADSIRLSDKKVIIYAPHHSVNYTEYKSATFSDNYLDILELAKKYSKDTYWIYKPHPGLRTSSVTAGIFDSLEGYDEYVSKWRALPNAEVADAGIYYSLFKGSDAMITDSVSFLAEYQFTGKPLLLLESGKEEYNEFGNSVVDILYKCDGKDIDGIEAFINDVVSGRDTMKAIREKYFQDNLNYRINGESASRRIYLDILKLSGRV